MAVFTAIATAFTAATAWFGGLSLFAQGLIKIGLGLVVNKISTSLAKKKAQRNKPTFGVSGQLQRGADIPQSFIFGTYATPGSLVWGDEWGGSANDYLTLVIEVSNIPVRGLNGLLIDGEEVTIEDSNPHADYGKRVGETTSGSKNYDGYVWVKFYDGTQTTADPWLSTAFTDGDYALDDNFIGYGNAYAIITYKVKNEGLWNGFPRAVFVVDGINLLNSSTSGSNTVHNNPVDVVYTLMRGLYYDNEWFFGSQKIQSAQLNNTNWGAQALKCTNAGFTCGGEVTVNTEVIDVIEELMSTMNGRMAESGGSFRILAVEPDAPVATFTDEDIITTSEQTFTPFIGLDNAINGISVVYPSPSDGWQNQTAPPLIRTDLEAEDDNRRMMSDVELPFVTDDEQVQRIMQTSLEEARRARKHNHTLPSNYWQVEPLDTIAWTSTRNGYTSKNFVVDGIIDMVNGDEIFDLTETDPSDYVWNSSTDFTPINRTPITSPVPNPQSVGNWSVSTEFLLDANGNGTTLGIRINYDGNVTGVDHLIYQVRRRDTQEIILEGMNLDISSGTRLLTKDFQLDTEYEARSKYVPTTNRETLWTAWTLVEEEPSSEPSVVITDFLRLQGETLVTSMKVAVSSDSVFYNKAQVRWKLDESGEEFSASTDGPLGDFTIPVVEDGKAYIVEVTLIGADGQLAPAYQYSYIVQGKNVKPGVVTNLSINSHGDVSTLMWTPPSDLDISHYKIKHSNSISNAKYSSSITLVEKVSRPATSISVPSITGTYFVRTFDKSGNASDLVASTILVNGSNLVKGYNVVELIEEHDQFLGTKLNTVIGESNGSSFLQLSGLTLFDDVQGNFDDAEYQFDRGINGVQNLGYYNFASTDLGSIFHCRVEKTIVMSRFGLSDLFDDNSGNFDQYEGLFEGSSDLIDEVDVIVEFSITDDDPNQSPTWSDWQVLNLANISFRSIKFRAILKSTNNMATPRLEELTIEIDMPDRDESDNDISFTGSKDITYSKAFKNIPAVGITIQNLPDGQRHRVYNKTESGFSVEILNGSVQSTSEVSMDYIAKGYGEAS